MKKILLFVLLVAFALPPVLADEEAYLFTCEELYEIGKQSAPIWSKGWFRAGFCIAFAGALIGFGAAFESGGGEDGLVEEEPIVGFAIGAGIGVGISIILPLLMTSPPSSNRYENAEADKCYTAGYLHKARATNASASFLGSLLGGPAAPVAVIGAVLYGCLSLLLEGQ